MTARFPRQALLSARALFLCVAVSLPASAVAQQDPEEPAANTALVDTVAYEPIPSGTRLETQPETQGELDSDAWRQVDSGLAARGFVISGGSPMVVTVATQLVDRLSSDQPMGSVIANNEGADVRANVFSTGGRSLLNPGTGINRSDRVFRVSITVYERGSGHYVWRGSAQRASGNLDPAMALHSMIPALLERFGTTASGVTVPLSH